MSPWPDTRGTDANAVMLKLAQDELAREVDVNATLKARVADMAEQFRFLDCEHGYSEGPHCTDEKPCASCRMRARVDAAEKRAEQAERERDEAREAGRRAITQAALERDQWKGLAARNHEGRRNMTVLLDAEVEHRTRLEVSEAKLRAALERYGAHHHYCILSSRSLMEAYPKSQHVCDCGLSAAREALAAGGGK